MRNLIAILLLGTLAFMLLAVAQEWDLFSAAWFGDEAPVLVLSEDERRAAADTVRMALTLMTHLYASEGDPRFAERMPVSGGMLEELQSDIAYLARNHRRQEMTLVRLEFTSVEPLDYQRVEIHTREYWQIRYLWPSGRPTGEPVQAHKIQGKYLVVREGRGWSVESWDMLSPEAETSS